MASAGFLSLLLGLWPGGCGCGLEVGKTRPVRFLLQPKARQGMEPGWAAGGGTLDKMQTLS